MKVTEIAIGVVLLAIAGYFLYAVSHRLRGLIGKGERKDGKRIDALREQVRDTIGEYACLA